MFVYVRMYILLSFVLLIGCTPQKHDALYVEGLKMSQYETSAGRFIAIRNVSDSSDTGNFLVIHIDKETRLMKSIGVSGADNPLVVIDFDEKIEPKSISLEVQKEGNIKQLVDFGELGSYDMAIDEEGGVHAVSFGTEWYQAKTSPQGVDAFIDGEWRRVKKTERGLSIVEP